MIAAAALAAAAVVAPVVMFPPLVLGRPLLFLTAEILAALLLGLLFFLGLPRLFLLFLSFLAPSRRISAVVAAFFLTAFINAVPISSAFTLGARPMVDRPAR